MDKKGRRELILKGARNAYPHAVSISDPEMGRIAEKLVKAKLLLKGRFKNGTGYQLTDAGLANFEQSNEAAYERDVQRAMKLLRISGGMDRKR